jgi:hypothetical protein
VTDVMGLDHFDERQSQRHGPEERKVKPLSHLLGLKRADNPASCKGFCRLHSPFLPP